MTEKARHYGYAANVGKEIDPAKGLVLQFELKLADGLTCGGAYLKFLKASADFDASGLVEETPYVVMFGPDKCGATNKVNALLCVVLWGVGCWASDGLMVCPYFFVIETEGVRCWPQ